MPVNEDPWPNLVSGRLSKEELWTVWSKNIYHPEKGDKCILVHKNPARSLTPFFEFVTVLSTGNDVYGIDNTTPGVQLIPRADIPQNWFFKRRI